MNRNKYEEDLTNLIPYWDFFKNKYSESSIKPIRLILLDFISFLQKKYSKGILGASSHDVLDYFMNIIDKKNSKRESKERIRYIISAYYNYVKAYKKDIEQVEFRNPVPSSKIFEFSGKTSTLNDLQKEFDLLTMKDVERIVKQLRYVKPAWMYIAGCLIIFSGARVREVAQIELANIDLKNRWFITEVKSNKANKRIGIYFFPDFFVPDLSYYIKTLKLRQPNVKFLFPSSRSKYGHISVRTIEKHMKDIKEELNIKGLTNPHAFRDFINSRWEEKGASSTQRKFLLNQKNPDVNINNYLKKYKNRLILRNLYDKLMPFDASINHHSP
ncbi:MAG: tyrosine-type recombinase/integrase [Candidatus Helarchaeota archaeon]